MSAAFADALRCQRDLGERALRKKQKPGEGTSRLLSKKMLSFKLANILYKHVPH